MTFVDERTITIHYPAANGQVLTPEAVAHLVGATVNLVVNDKPTPFYCVGAKVLPDGHGFQITLTPIQPYQPYPSVPER